jgi:hypothetical protein
MCDEQNLKDSEYKVLIKEPKILDALDLMLQWPEDKVKRAALLKPTNITELAFEVI